MKTTWLMNPIGNLHHPLPRSEMTLEMKTKRYSAQLKLNEQVGLGIGRTS